MHTLYEGGLKIEDAKFFSYKRPIKWLLFFLYLTIIYIILPVSLAIFVAYLAFPLVQVFHRVFKLPYWLSSILTEIILLLSICLVFLLTFQSMLGLLPGLKEKLSQVTFLANYDSVLISLVQEKSLEAFDVLLTVITQIVQSIFQYAIEFLIFIVALFFALFESRKSRTWFFVYVPASYRNEWKNYFSKGMQLFSYFLYVEFQLLALTFILLSCGLSLLGFEQAVSKALLISLADSLPFFGIGLFLIPMSIYFFIIGKTYLCVTILILYIFIQLTRQLVESMLWASTLHLRTVHTFFISAASILIFGFYGILLSPFFFFLAVRFKEKSAVLNYR